MKQLSYRLSLVSLVLLTLLCVFWELKVVPVKTGSSGGSWMVLKCVPLLLLWHGFFHQRVKTYQLASLLVWVYFAEGVTRAWSERGLSAGLAGVEIVLSLALFVGVVLYSRSHKIVKQSK